MSSTAGAVERAPAAVDAMTVGRQLIATIGWALVLLMPALALVLVVRRLGGAFDRPLGGLAIVVVAVMLVAITCLLRWPALQIQFPNLSTQYSVLSTDSPIGFGMVSVIAIVVLAALTLPSTPVVGIIFAWVVLISGEAAQGLFHFRPELWRQWIAQRGTDSASMSNSPAEEAEIPAGLVQQVTRVREGDHESLHALMRAEIPSGDRLAVLHLSFCPPLAGAPELTAHAVDAENVEMRVTQAETFGARVEVRLPSEDATPRSLMVEVLGTVTSRRGA